MVSALDPLAPPPDELEWLPISISQTRGQNSAYPAESELPDLELSAIDENELITFRASDGAPDEAQRPTSPPEPVLPTLVLKRIEPYEEYIRRGPPTKRRGRPCTRPISPSATVPTRRRRIRGRPEPPLPTEEDLLEEVQVDPLDAWPSTRHVQPQIASEPESADVAVPTWRGIQIGPATATEAQLVVDVLSAIRDGAPVEEKERLGRAVLGLPASYGPSIKAVRSSYG